MKKIIGCSFELECGYTNHYAIIFKNIDIKKFSWYVRESEIYKEGNLDCLFESNFYKGQEFEKKINEGNYHLIHSSVFAALPNKEIYPNMILTYEDYCNSNCNIAFLCADCYVDFYSKDEHIVKAVANTYKDKISRRITLFTEDSNPRTSFLI